jgi:uncharacterized protein
MGSSLNPNIKGSISGVEVHHICKKRKFKTLQSKEAIVENIWDTQVIVLHLFLGNGAMMTVDLYCTTL